MAFTERYVTSAAGGGGIGTEGDPWTLAEALTNSVAGDRVNILSDAGYSLGVDAVTGAGNATQLLVFRGYDTAIGDLAGQKRNADTPLNTTGFPVITLTGILTMNAFVSLNNLSFTGALSSVLIGDTTIDNWQMISCAVVNTQNNASAGGIAGDNIIRIINSDLSCSGAAHGIILNADNNITVVGCRLKGVADSSYLQLNYGTITKTVFIGNNTGIGINLGAFTNTTLVMECTLDDFDEAVVLPNVVVTNPPIFIDNHITENGRWLDSLYSGTAANVVIEINNRTRDNITPRTGIGDGTNISEITTDTGGPETDYVNAGADNFRLISGAPGETSGLIEFSDVGAYQREPSAGAGGLLQANKRGNKQ